MSKPTRSELNQMDILLESIPTISRSKMTRILFQDVLDSLDVEEHSKMMHHIGIVMDIFPNMTFVDALELLAKISMVIARTK